MIAAIRRAAAEERVPVGAMIARSGEAATEVPPSTAMGASTGPRATASGHSAGKDEAQPAGGSGRSETPPASSEAGRAVSDAAAGTGGAEQSAAAEGQPLSGPCVEERRAVDERCALADRMRTLADQAAATLRETQREYDLHVSRADEAAAMADPRAQRAAKDAAQRSFRTGRESAGTREAVEAAARTWLQEINRINAEAREANATLTSERAAAAPLLTTIERLTVQADGARVQAESAQEACIAAREALATCEEEEQRSTGTMPLEPSLAPDEAPSRAPAWAEAPMPILGATSAPAEVDEGGLLEAAALGGQPAILRLLAGDHSAMQRIVIAVAGDDPDERRRWQLLLADFVDAVLARAIEACAFEFPADHQFWAPFTRSQARDIAIALSSLGYRFDGLRGFADERVPSQRDLSLALSYAGLDPMRVRRWPNEEEMAGLFADVSVAADEYLAGAASGLTLGELVSLLGRRADPLTDLWNAWGRVRPLLLEPSERSNRPSA